MTIPNVRRGFTLIELLVALTIVGLLSALLLPGLVKARENAHQTVCESNLHQIGLAIEMYQEDYEGALPTQFNDASALPANERAGCDQLLPYEHSPNIYHCPDGHPPPPGDARLDYRYRVNDLQDITTGIMKPAPTSVLVYDYNHRQRSDGEYIVLRANGSVSRIPERQVVFWTYVRGQWTQDAGDGELWEVFPDEPWPPQFEN